MIARSLVMTGDRPSEEHRARLERCRQFYADDPRLEPLTTEFDLMVDEQYRMIWVNEVMEYLFDTWSAIRFECAKLLKRVVPRLSNAVIGRLLALLVDSLCHLDDDSDNKPRSWQELHGTLEGIKSIVEVVDVSHLDRISSGSLALIGHVSIPVRESASEALGLLFSIQPDKGNFIHRILMKVRSLMGDTSLENDECTTLTLDGCLSCLVNIFSHSTARQSPLKTSVDLQSHVQQEWPFISTVITRCFYHPASSVRQRAGQVITFILSHYASSEHSCGDNSSLPFPYVLATVVTEVLPKAKGTSWCAEEVCLIVSEEVSKAVLDSYLASVDIPGGYLTAILDLEALIRSDLAYYMAHERYEVRRVIVQILPVLARCTLIFGHIEDAVRRKGGLLVGCLSEEGNGEEDVSRHVYREVDEEPDSSLLTEPTPSHHVLLSTKMVWASALIKENRHLLEAIHGYLPAVLSASDHWGPEMTGRLQEVHLRQHFRDQLNAALQLKSGESSDDDDDDDDDDGDENGDDNDGRLRAGGDTKIGFGALCCALQCHDVCMLDLLDDIYAHFLHYYQLDSAGLQSNLHQLRARPMESGAQPCATDHLFLSTDFVEFYTLARVYLYSVYVRTSWLQCLPDHHVYRFERRGQGECEAWDMSMLDHAQHLQQLYDSTMSGLWLQYLAVVSYSHIHSSTHGSSSSNLHQPRKKALEGGAVSYLILSLLAGQYTYTHICSHTLKSASRRSRASPGHSDVLIDSNPFNIQFHAGLMTVGSVHGFTNCKGCVYIPGVLLLPSLMDPSTHPALHVNTITQHAPHVLQHLRRSFSVDATGFQVALEDVQLLSPRPQHDLQAARAPLTPSTPVASAKLGGGPSSSMRRRTSMPALLHSPQRIHMHPSPQIFPAPPNGSVAATPPCPPSASTPLSTLVMQSPQPASATYNPYAYTSTRSSYAAMDRWHCEAISPLLATLAHTLHHLDQAVWLCSLCVEWLYICTHDPLWLDGRPFARRILLESIHTLLTAIYNKLPSAAPHTATEVRIVSVHWTKMICDVIAHRIEPAHGPGGGGGVDYKALSPLVKALSTAQLVASDLHPDIFSSCVSSYVDQAAHRGMQVSLLVAPTEAISDAVNAVFRVVAALQQLLPPSTLEGDVESMRGHFGGTRSTSGNVPVQTPAAVLPETFDIEDDEFSDWDEEESVQSVTSETLLHTTESLNLASGVSTYSISNAVLSAAAISTTKKYAKTTSMLAEMLFADVEYVHRYAAVWRARLEECQQLGQGQGQNSTA